MSKTIRIGTVKGNLIPVLNKYLQSLDLAPVTELRKLVHYREYNGIQMEIVLFRWEDLKKHKNDFDLIIGGSDQWLETGHKSMVILDYFEQDNCRLSMLVKEEDQEKSPDYFLGKKIATSFPNLARSYLSIKPENITTLSGSVESAVTLGWADFILDLVSSGKTAKENGLVEYKKCFDIGAILATTKVENIKYYEELKLIKPMSKRKIIAFDGIDGSGKSTLSKYFAQNQLYDDPTVLVCPYSGDVGKKAQSLLDNGNVFDWAVNVGTNHWRCSEYVNMVYDRNILTCLTELIQAEFSKEDISKILEYWEPLPDIIFYCQLSLKEVIKRSEARHNKDIYDEESLLIKYYDLYEQAFEYVKENTDINIVKINTEIDMMLTIEEVKTHLEKG